MTCEPKFTATIEYGCITQVLTAIRNPTGNWQENLGVALWAGGCANKLLKSENPPTMFQSDDSFAKLSIQEMAEKLQEAIDQPHTAAAVPAIAWMILKLVAKFACSLV